MRTNRRIQMHRDRCTDERGGVAGVYTFAVSGVEGHANASATDSHGKVRGRISDKARRDSRYQARPDCTVGRCPETPVLFRLYNGAVASRTLTDSKNDLGVVVTAGETAKICEGMAGSPASAGAGSTSALRATCHPKRSWLCRVAAGFIHALGGRDIAIRTRIAKPIAMGNGRLAIGYAPPLQFFGIDDVALKRTSTHIGTNVKSQFISPL